MIGVTSTHVLEDPTRYQFSLCNQWDLNYVT